MSGPRPTPPHPNADTHPAPALPLPQTPHQPHPPLQVPRSLFPPPESPTQVLKPPSGPGSTWSSHHLWPAMVHGDTPEPPWWAFSQTEGGHLQEGSFGTKGASTITLLAPPTPPHFQPTAPWEKLAAPTGGLLPSWAP